VRRALALLGTLALACALLAGCGSSSPSTGRGTGGGSSVDVDTAALRHQRAQAGIEPCPAATSHNQLPGLRLPCLGGGRSVDLAKLPGPMVINLFAQWCGPCRGELPYYQRLHRESKGKLHVLGVDYLDTQPARALQLARQTGVTYPLLADPDGRLRGYRGIGRGLPGVVLVDASGKVVGVQFRVVSSYAGLRGLVRRQLHVHLPA
jgi:thiol-disulfide isomerase/thioredoxin